MKGLILMRTWERKGYKVVEVEYDGDLSEFEVIKDDEVIATITPATIEDMELIINDLDNGEDVNGWEDGMGNTVYIEIEEDENMKFINYLKENLTTKKYNEVIGNLDPLNDIEAKWVVFSLMQDRNAGTISDSDIVSETDEVIIYRDYHEFKSFETKDGNPLSVDIEWEDRYNQDNDSWETNTVTLPEFE